MSYTSKNYIPNRPFTTVAELYNPTYKKVKGVNVKDWELVGTINCSFKTYGGTESTVNDVLTVIDTANVETWYRPDITSASQLMVNGKKYEVMGDPEDIELRHQFLKLKVRGVKGGC